MFPWMAGLMQKLRSRGDWMFLWMDALMQRRRLMDDWTLRLMGVLMRKPHFPVHLLFYFHNYLSPYYSTRW